MQSSKKIKRGQLEPTNLTINGVTLDTSQDRQWRAGLSNTGVLTYNGITQASATTVNIGAVTGIITDNETTPGTPSYVTINYAGQSGVTVPTIAGGPGTYVLLDKGVVTDGVGAGQLVFQNTYPTSAQRKSMIYLSKISHPDLVNISFVLDEVDFVTSPLQQFRDLFQVIQYMNQGVKANGNAGLTINTEAGNILGDGINFVANRANPNMITVASANPRNFLLLNRSGASGGFVTAIDPLNYDVGGVTTLVGGGTNNSTIQYLYFAPGVGFAIQRGQTIYPNLTDAIAAVGRETFVVRPNLVNNSILIAAIAIRHTTTNMNDTAFVRILPADKFGQIGGAASGISVSTFQTIYGNSVIPQLTTNTLLGAVTYQRGSASDADTVFQIRNGAGTTTWLVTGAGNVTGNSFVKTGGTSVQFLKADGTVDSNTYALASQLHNPVTIGTANGLSLATQVLSLALASTSTTGALSSTDWNTFNNKQAALVSGTNIKTINSVTLLGSGNIAVEPVITAGTTAQYYRGDKTFQTLDTLAVPENTNLYFTENRVRSTLLTGYTVGTNTALAATDSVLIAFGKIQAQINAVGGGGITGSGTTNTVPKFTSGTAIGNSNITDNGTVITLGSNTTLNGIMSSTNTGGTKTRGLNLANSGTGATDVLQVSNSSSGRGMFLSNSVNGIGCYAENIGVGQAFRITESGGGIGAYVINTVNGTGVAIENSGAGTGLNISHSGNSYGILLQNNGAGFGLYGYNLGSGNLLHLVNDMNATATCVKITNQTPFGYGIDLTNAADVPGFNLDNQGNSYGMHVTNNGSGRGISVINNIGGEGVTVVNNGSGNGMRILNNTMTNALYIDQAADGGIALQVANSVTSGTNIMSVGTASYTGNLYEGVFDANTVFKVEQSGLVTGSGFAIPGGTNTQFLMADGSTSAGGGGGGISGSGTTNFVPKWTGATAQGNSLIASWPSGTVGIGYASDSGNGDALEVNGSIAAGGFRTDLGTGNQQLLANGTIASFSIKITTSVSITSTTTGVDAVSGTGSQFQNGRNVIIANGANAINYTCNGGIMAATYLKTGTAAITFVAGGGRTLVLMSGTAVLNGIAGSTASLMSDGTVDYLYITNF